MPPVVPLIDNGEGLYVDREHRCIWVGDDTTSKLYKISFKDFKRSPVQYRTVFVPLQKIKRMKRLPGFMTIRIQE